MKIKLNATIEMSNDDIVEVTEKVLNRVLHDGVDSPEDRISKAITNGLKTAFLETLGKKWGDDLMSEIASEVAKATAPKK